MAGIFPSPTGVPASDTDNGYEPAIPPIGGPARFYGPNCETTLYYWALNALVSEILAAVDRLGYAYNSSRVDNLGAALADVIGNIELTLTAAVSDIGALQGDMTAAEAAIAALQGAVTTIQGDLLTIGGDITAIDNYLANLEASQVKLVPAIGGHNNVRSLLEAMYPYMGTMADQTVKGNDSGGAAPPQDLTMAQLAAMLPLAGGNKGLLRPLSGVTTEFLRGDGTWGAIVGAIAHGEVYFSYDTGTQVARLSREGNGGIIIDNLPYYVPAAGVTLSAAGAVAGTAYMVFAYINAGDVALEYAALPAATRSIDPRNGVWVKTGDVTRTVVGMVYCAVNGAWAPATSVLLPIASFFNKKQGIIQASCSSYVHSSTSETSLTSNSAFLAWSGDASFGMVTGGGTALIAGAYTFVRPGWNNVGVGQPLTTQSTQANIGLGVGASAAYTFSTDGLNYFSIRGYVSSGSNSSTSAVGYASVWK